MPPGPIVKVGFELDQPSGAIFDGIRANSRLLESLKSAVLDSANDMATMPGGRLPCPTKGARWTNPDTNQRRNVYWVYLGDQDTTDTVSVKWIR